MRTFILIILAIIASSTLVYSGMQPKPIKEVLSEIRQEQKLKDDDSINADIVSAAKLEELGDSVMETMIGNSERHEQMDNMMGGDGSASLAAMHRRIGYNYLSGYPMGMMNIMSGGMMGVPNTTFFNHGGRFMMNGYYPGMMGGFGWGFGGIFMFVFFLIIVSLAVYFVYRTMRSKYPTETPLEILKKRYARGEITKEDFETMKKDINS